MAQLIAPLVLVVFMVYGGNFANAEIIPDVLAWIQWLSPIRYAYMASFQNEFEGLTFLCFGDQPPINGSCIPGFATGEQVIRFYDQDVVSILVCCMVILAFGLFYHLMAYITLRCGYKPKLYLI